MGEDPVNPLGGFDVLAKLGDRLVGGYQRVERVQAGVGHCRGMGASAAIGHLDLGDADTRHGGEVHARGMNHHGRIHTVERPFLGHQFLAAPAFFCRRAQVTNPARKITPKRGQCQRRPEPCHRNNIMPAGMADAGQRVILGQDRHPWAVGADLALVGSFKTVGTASHGQSCAFNVMDESGRCLVLLKRQFRDAVNGMAGLQQCRCVGINRITYSGLEISHRTPWGLAVYFFLPNGNFRILAVMVGAGLVCCRNAAVIMGPISSYRCHSFSPWYRQRA